ncbi:MAG: hypothetical protein FWD57_02445, partial [Polyangiaceae bacterium]|nr:hypothetical protein [Polyangiaceae bacterium]
KPNAAVGSSAISIQRSITSRLANYSDCSGLSCRFGFCNWLDWPPSKTNRDLGNRQPQRAPRQRSRG